MKQIRLALSETQKNFINKVAEKEGIVTGELVWRALLYVNREVITTNYLMNYITFITDKEHNAITYLQNRFTLHNDLKILSQSYKEIGYNIKMKGVVLLYVLYYADKVLNMNISQYRVKLYDEK
ncbi:hypothetical protein JP28_11960 [Gallibacterium anatis]|uniref:hypothetical protein n=1 Tax=Gallibacterium anatis TaxID=750 RepID=UPI0005312A07|nr:hypothetical protein [Gallibacterium anatis]KGQ42098.1 hypothetical protein JP28_11960 [Gallibacterium anatis]KGQ47058.1 hypothetical protein IO46_13520 [Gallibacterium anatis]